MAPRASALSRLAEATGLAPSELSSFLIWKFEACTQVARSPGAFRAEPCGASFLRGGRGLELLGFHGLLHLPQNYYLGLFGFFSLS